MRVYSKKMFFFLVLLVCMIGVATVELTTWSFGLVLSIPKIRIYQQLVNYDIINGKPMPCVRLNHTIVVSTDTPMIENILTIDKSTDIPPDVKIEISFGEVIPRLIDGNLLWSGQIYANQTRTLYARLAFDANGTYLIHSEALAGFHSLSMGLEGVSASYYITVQEGKITRVADKDGLELTPKT